MQLKRLLCWLPVLAVLQGCEPKPLEGGKEIAAEAERHKVKRFTREEIEEAARKAGDSIVEAARAEMLQRLNQGLETGGTAEAMLHCLPEQYPGVVQLAKTYGAVVARTSQKLRNPHNRATGRVQEQLQALRQPTEGATVQELDRNLLLYTRPIAISDQVCLRCHGTPGLDFTGADYAPIRARYPSDEAVGYKAGELRGMWHITLQKKNLLQTMGLPKKRKRR